MCLVRTTGKAILQDGAEVTAEPQSGRGVLQWAGHAPDRDTGKTPIHNLIVELKEVAR